MHPCSWACGAAVALWQRASLGPGAGQWIVLMRCPDNEGAAGRDSKRVMFSLFLLGQSCLLGMRLLWCGFSLAWDGAVWQHPGILADTGWSVGCFPERVGPPRVSGPPRSRAGWARCVGPPVQLAPFLWGLDGGNPPRCPLTSCSSYLALNPL